MSKKPALVSDLVSRFRTPYLPFERTDDLSFEGSSTLTHQSFRDECDINNIMSRFEKTGVLPEMIKSNPQYGDFSELPSYQDSLHIVLKAEEQFSALSASVRKRFHNDPSEFLDFVNDPSNVDEMVKLGLATKPDAGVPSSEAPETASPALKPDAQASVDQA